MIESEFIFKLFVLLLDGPSMMRQAHQRQSEAVAGQGDERRLDAGRRAKIVLEEDSDPSRRAMGAPLVRGRHASAAKW